MDSWNTRFGHGCGTSSTSQPLIPVPMAASRDLHAPSSFSRLPSPSHLYILSTYILCASAPPHSHLPLYSNHLTSSAPCLLLPCHTPMASYIHLSSTSSSPHHTGNGRKEDTGGSATCLLPAFFGGTRRAACSPPPGDACPALTTATSLPILYHLPAVACSAFGRAGNLLMGCQHSSCGCLPLQ